MTRARARFAVAPAAAFLLLAAPAAAQWPAPPQPGFGQPGYAPSASQQPGYAPPASPPSSIGLPIFGIPAGMPQIIEPPVPMPGARELEQKLDQSKRDDAGRKLEWVWIDAHGGFEQVGLTTFSGSSDLTGGLVPTSSSGALVGVGAGVRLLFLTLLARGRLGVGSIGHLYRIGPEIGLHVPLGRIEPHVELGGGYAAFGHLAGNAGNLGLRGGYGRAGLGVDVFLASIFSLGLGFSGELLGMKSSGGSGLGGSLAVTAMAGLHL
ncbi:MAG: hypothetical protein QM820_37515 [Minicystis sp.]